MRLLAFVPLLVCACALQSAPGPSPASADSQAVTTEPVPKERIVKLEDGTYLKVKRGTEPGFMHCCGDESYMMEMNCSDRLMRCYAHRGNRWKQTYGKQCKRALSQECYLETCSALCEAVSSVGGQL